MKAGIHSPEFFFFRQFSETREKQFISLLLSKALAHIRSRVARRESHSALSGQENDHIAVPLITLRLETLVILVQPNIYFYIIFPRAAPVAEGGSQAQDQIKTVATGHSP